MKKLGEAKAGEKIYRVVINASNIIETCEGKAIECLTIKKTESLGDYFSVMLTLSDNTRVRGHINNEVATSERITDDSVAHPMAIFEDVYCQDKQRLLKAVSNKLSENIDRMKKLREESLKILNSATVANNRIEMLIEQMPAEETLTEEEFAAIALG